MLSLPFRRGRNHDRRNCNLPQRLGCRGDLLAGLFLIGIIGARLHKNRGKSPGQLAAGSAGEPYTSKEWDPADDPKIGRSVRAFFLMVGATTGALAYYYEKPAWFILGTIIGSWVFFLVCGGLLGFILLRRSE